jgi:hypothetical protein
MFFRVVIAFSTVTSCEAPVVSTSSQTLEMAEFLKLCPFWWVFSDCHGGHRLHVPNS